MYSIDFNTTLYSLGRTLYNTDNRRTVYTALTAVNTPSLWARLLSAVIFNRGYGSHYCSGTQQTDARPFVVTGVYVRAFLSMVIITWHVDGNWSLRRLHNNIELTTRSGIRSSWLEWFLCLMRLIHFMSVE